MAAAADRSEGEPRARVTDGIREDRRGDRARSRPACRLGLRRCSTVPVQGSATAAAGGRRADRLASMLAIERSGPVAVRPRLSATMRRPAVWCRRCWCPGGDRDGRRAGGESGAAPALGAGGGPAGTAAAGGGGRARSGGRDRRRLSCPVASSRTWRATGVRAIVGRSPSRCTIDTTPPGATVYAKSVRGAGGVLGTLGTTPCQASRSRFAPRFKV